RTDFYPDYKAHRPDPPDELIPQFRLIREAVRAFDLPCLEQDGFEADDLIATYVREACAGGASATIVSSDKDLMQLVNDCVVMYDTMKDKKIGIPEVIEKFGVPPEKVIEVQALIGDSTDNVPGVPGIGVKTAAQLISEYGDLETLLSRVGEIKQEKRRQSLIDNAEKARLSKRLVTLDDHVALDVPLVDLAVHEPDYKRLIAFLKAMEFNTLLRRVAEFSDMDAHAIDPDAKVGPGAWLRARAASDAASATAPAPSSPPAGASARSAQDASAAPSLPLEGGSMKLKPRPEPPASEALTPQARASVRLDAARSGKIDRSRYETVCTPERLREWVARAIDLGTVAIDAQASSIDPMQAALVGFSLALAPNEACYVPLAHREAGSGGGDGGLFAGDIAPDQIPESEALAIL